MFVLELRGIAITSLYIATALGVRIRSALCRSYGKGSTTLVTATSVRVYSGMYYPKYILASTTIDETETR